MNSHSSKGKQYSSQFTNEELKHIIMNFCKSFLTCSQFTNEELKQRLPFSARISIKVRNLPMRS